MAVLTSIQLAQVRRGAQSDNLAAPIDKTRAVFNLAIQSVEDWFELARPGTAGALTALSVFIDLAIAPATMTAAEKRRVVKYWMGLKADLE